MKNQENQKVFTSEKMEPVDFFNKRKYWYNILQIYRISLPFAVMSLCEVGY